MKCKGNRKSKRTKLSLKYNIQKRVKEKHRRMKKEAKKMGLKKKVRKDPGIPNSWPFKAEMLADLERQKQDKDAEMAKRKAAAKQKARKDKQQQALDAKRLSAEAAEERRKKRAEAVEKSQHDVLRKTLGKADALLEVLDARDPMGCRCTALESWARETGKRLIFVVAKADLIPAETATRWLKALGQAGPTVVVQAEAGRDGVKELLAMLGQSLDSSAAASGSAPSACKAVGIVGYPGTGKQALGKAMRREARGLAPWLMEPVCRLRAPADASLSAEAALHRIACPAASKKEGKKEGKLGVLGAEPQAVLACILSRVAPAQLSRRLRLQAFEGIDQLCSVFAQDRKITTKKGNKPSMETVSKRLVEELSKSPGIVFCPSEAALDGSAWAAHEKERAALQQIMEAQFAALGARAGGPAAAPLALGSPAVPGGPPVDVAAILASGDAESEVDDDDDDDDMSDCDMEGEEGEEEELGEGDEEEDEMDDEE